MAITPPSSTPAPAPATAPAAPSPAPAAPSPSQPRYEIRSADANYSGIHPLGLRFRDGMAETDDAIVAHASLESGNRVIDRLTGQPPAFAVTPTPPAKPAPAAAARSAPKK